ncbi:MBL fold metallo-hydrolase [Microbacterium sp. NPDC089189]|uniref:MBL fold metallo-hydrolase n=1 Tax=Microbacterium sp. NPDC089189 TaxID=3154972 RepID=UPI003415EDF8
MKITHVRNATMLLEVDGMQVLIDPMLGARGSQPPFRSETGDVSRNPLVDLVVPLSDLLHPNVVVVTHTHTDHWDAAAAALLPRDMPILVQDDADAGALAESGFTDVRVLTDALEVGGVRFHRTGGQHGSSEFVARYPKIGTVMGVVVRGATGPAVYLAGDTVLGDDVRSAIAAHVPDVIVLNTGEARLPDSGPIIMGAHDVVDVARLAPDARIVAVHMEALNHCVVSRDDVRRAAADARIDARLWVPEDGEMRDF